jgi:hypothetical protein
MILLCDGVQKNSDKAIQSKCRQAELAQNIWQIMQNLLILSGWNRLKNMSGGFMVADSRVRLTQSGRNAKSSPNVTQLDSCHSQLTSMIIEPA